MTASALTCTEELIIGVAGGSSKVVKHFDVLVDGSLLDNKKFKEMLEPYDVRVHRVEKFVRLVNPRILISCVRLTDPWGADQYFVLVRSYFILI